jgi:hypothetical protein
MKISQAAPEAAAPEVSANSALSTGSPTLDQLFDEFSTLSDFEVGLHKLYLGLVDGATMLKFAETQMLELIDCARTRQFDIVHRISRLEAANVNQLKLKAQVLLAYFSSEDGDAQSDLVRSLASDLVKMPLREFDATSLTRPTLPEKKRAVSKATHPPKHRFNEPGATDLITI